MTGKMIIDGSIRADGIDVIADGKKYSITYPHRIWGSVPEKVKGFLMDNLVFATTHFLPVMLDKEIEYKTKRPLFEPHLFMNQLYDMLECERSDDVERLSYLKKHFNSSFDFKEGKSIIPVDHHFKADDTVIIPFTFGKESLVVLGICLELGLKPILVYSQEPSHPYEERIKKEMLERLTKKTGVMSYFISNETGLFRYGKAFNIPFTELGWGSQTTILSLMMIPFAYHFRAGHIWYGNEFSCNSSSIVDGWKSYSAAGFDQTSEWTQHQSNMIRTITSNSCQVNSILEPVEEILALFILHNRYPDLGKLQFSCDARLPIKDGERWCYRCDKCAYIYLFLKALGFENNISFNEDMLNKKGLYSHYFKEIDQDLWKDRYLGMTLLAKSNIESPYVKRFKSEVLPFIGTSEEQIDRLIRINPSRNLPEGFEQRILNILIDEIQKFKARYS